MRSKDGLISCYGTPGTAGHDPAVVAAPACRKKVFAWKLTHTEDPFGNCIVYEYERDLGEDGPHHWDQVYLKRIRYVDYTAQGETKYLVSVTFLYADRPFSFRQQFADQWYDLHNPDQSSTPMVVSFSTSRDDFPPNIEDQSLKIQHVVPYFIRADGAQPFEVSVTHLQFIIPGPQPGTTVPIGGGATTIDGVISTRKGNAANWIGMIGQEPFQNWELALPNTADIKNHFVHEEIEDILFVITYSGRTPEWPA